jgi:hypothetical protein
MNSEIELCGEHIRLEPLDFKHVDGLVAAANGRMAIGEREALCPSANSTLMRAIEPVFSPERQSLPCFRC